MEEVLRIGEESFTPQIQHEVVEQGETVLQTEAGAYLNQALLQQRGGRKGGSESTKNEAEWCTERTQAMFSVFNFRCCQYNSADRIFLGRRCHDAGRIAKQERKLSVVIVGKEEEIRVLHLNNMEALKKQIATLERDIWARNEEYINRLGIWHRSWKSLICKDMFGSRIIGCPSRNFKQRNIQNE